ncbi:hypothetical protein ABNN70_03980 [Sporolactobacillus sp. Y61]|uniref:Uncharacterized protein n=1 Tax=Sporolactobacillus sp. Y61 TaxID=3160863 RepID=A0AAU8IHD7_9BACL
MLNEESASYPMDFRMIQPLKNISCFPEMRLKKQAAGIQFPSALYGCVSVGPCAFM